MKIVIDSGSKNYLKKKLKRHGRKYNKKEVLDKLHDLLDDYECSFPQNKKIIIEKSDELGGHYLGNGIYISSRYVLDYLTLDESEFIGQCIIECVGHELGHSRVNMYCPLFGLLIKRVFLKFASHKDKFIARLIEVYCDHYSMEFTGFSKDIHQRIMCEHLKRKKSVGKDKDTDYSHPTWAERSEYIMYDFNEELIRKIAKDNDYDNEEEIQKQIRYYEKVNECDGYIEINTQAASVLRLVISIVMLLGFVFTFWGGVFSLI